MEVYLHIVEDFDADVVWDIFSVAQSLQALNTQSLKPEYDHSISAQCGSPCS